MSHTRIIVTVIMALFIPIIGGCQKDKLPSNSYRVEIEDIVEMDDLIVKRITIAAIGQKRFHLQLPSGSEDMATFGRSNSGGLSRMTLTIVAEQFETSEQSFNRLRWLIKADGSSMKNGTALYESDTAKNISDRFGLKLKAGLHSVGMATGMIELNENVYGLLID